MWSCGTQRRALPRHQCEEMKILNISFLRVRIEPTTVVFVTMTSVCSIVKKLLGEHKRVLLIGLEILILYSKINH